MVATLVQDLREAGHDPATVIVTADVLHTQHPTATLLHTAGAGYVLTVKANQPGLRTAIAQQSHSRCTRRPGRTGRSGRGHRRTEQRVIEVVPATGIDVPGATQAFRITRYTGGLDGQRRHKQVVHPHHQPHRRRNRRHPARPPGPRALVHPEQRPLGPQHDLPRR